MTPDWLQLDAAAIEALFPVLAEHALRSSVLLLAALAVTALLRRRAAAIRHALWVSVFAVVALLPLATWILPQWQVLPFEVSSASMEPTVGGGAQVNLDGGALPAAAIPNRLSIKAARARSVYRDDTSADSIPGQSDTTGLAVTEPNAAGDSTLLSAVIRSMRALVSRAGTMTPARWLVLLWLVGVAVNFVRQARGAVHVARIARVGREPSPAVRALADRARALLHVKRRVDIRLNASVAMPATWGGRRAVILLPVSAEHWDTDRLWHVILHELAHVSRHDHTVQSVARSICAVLWFNPFLWMGLRSLRTESESACDDLVMLAGSQASRYAGHLVGVARSVRDTSKRLPAAALAMAHPARLEHRVRSILDPRKSRRPMKARHALLSMTAVLFVALPVAVAAPQEAPPPPPPPKPVAEKPDMPPPPADALPPAPHSPVADALPATPREPQDSLPPEPRSPVADALPTPPRSETDALPDRSTLDADRVPMTPDLPPVPPAPALRGVPDAVPPTVAPADTIKNRARIIAAFIEALEDPDPEIRRQAAWALGELEAQESVEPLARVLASDSEPDVRRAALYALAELDPASAAPIIAEGFASETEPEVRRQMLWMLAESGDAAAIAIVESALDDGDPGVRQAALVAATEIGHASMVPHLTRALDDPEPDNQRMAIHALAEIVESGMARDDAVAGLVRATESSDPRVRQAAVAALAEVKSEAAVPALVRATSDPEAEVRRYAIWALAESESPEAAPALVRAAEDSDPEVRGFAIRALAEHADARSTGIMTRALDDADPDVRRTAIMALAESGDPDAVPALRHALEDSDPEVRSMAIWGLAEAGERDPAVVEHLATVVDGDSDPDVRRAAVHALGDIGGDAAMDALTRAIKDSDPEVRKAALAALASLVSDSR